MAKMSLRSYLKEVDSLIDRGENAEAIAHCKYILKIYPKYIPVYSLLGKAYLESQRYSEALDIFKRVLSVYPDDFIAHLSLSIIREGEENLDAAIFHMERAYEVEPANAGIQNELRRLYGRRDGAIPPRVRLTRGALVRMYERGELYRQAIAEIRAALTEHPDRIDLKVILCRMCFLASQKVEATDIASQLISKLPYCFEANRILAVILPGTSRADDAGLYQKRIIDLDPYFAFTSLSSPNTLHVPENAIQLEQLDARMAETSTDFGWAQNLGISLPGPSVDEELPDWFHTSSEPQPQVAQEPFISPDLGSEPPAQESEIPDFIRQAGFVAASGPEQPTTLEISESEEILSVDGESLATAEIPDWLQSIAPTETSPRQPTTSEDDSWFAGLIQQAPHPSLPESELDSTSQANSQSEELPDLQPTSPELPEWLKSEVPDQVEPAPPTLPDWLSEPPVMPDRNELPDDSQQPADLPDWLQGLDVDQETNQPEAPIASTGEELTPEPTGSEEDVPEWLRSLSTPQIPPVEIPQPSQLQTEESLSPPELPDWITGEIPQAEKSVSEPELQILEETPISDSTEEILSDTISLSPEASSSTPSSEDQFVTNAEVQQLIPETPTEGDGNDGLPAWLSEIPTPTEQADEEMPVSQVISDHEPVDQIEAAELPEWLTEITTPANQSESTPESDAFASGIHENDQSEVLTESLMSESQGEFEPTSGMETPEISMLNINEEVEDSDLPDRIYTPVEESTEESNIDGSSAELSLPDQTPETYLPDWLLDLDQEIPQAQDQKIETLETPDFNIASNEQPENLPILSVVPGEPPQEEHEIPENLGATLYDEENQKETQAPTQPVAVSQSVSESSEQPVNQSEVAKDTDQLIVEETPSETNELEIISAEPTTPLAEEMPTDLEAALAWMEALAARQGAIDGTLSDEAEQQSTDMPEWLQREVELSNESQLPPLPVGEEPQGPIGEVSINPDQIETGTFETREPEIEAIPLSQEIQALESEPETINAETAESPTIQQDVESDLPTKAIQPEMTGEAEQEIQLPEWLQEINESVSSQVEQPASDTMSDEWVREEEALQEPQVTEANGSQETVFTPPPAEIISASPADQDFLTGPSEVKSEISSQEHLEKAQFALKSNDLTDAANEYEELINSGDLLEETIHDLREALDRYPMETPLYQLLGDAYLKTNRLQEAIDAYTKAEQLLR